MKITGIILAGGKSKRFGKDKALIEWQGKTLFENAVDLCRPFTNSLLISSNHTAHNQFGIEVVPDKVADCGPMGGIYSCLDKSDTEWNFVISVDSPAVHPGFIQTLISESGKYDAVIPLHEQGIEPLVALYHRDILDEIEKSIERREFKMHDLIRKLNSKFVDSQTWLKKYPNLFHNINRPDDLAFNH